MKIERIVIAGGNGYLGSFLFRYFSAMGIEVIIIARKKVSFTNRCYVWDGENMGEWTSAIEGANIVLNLAGKSVNCRYTEVNKRKLYHSRLRTTELIGEAIKAAKHKPALWINASSATVYRHAVDKPMDEISGELGEDFSPSLVKAWEEKFYACQIEGVRQVALRMAIALSKEGGVIPYYVNLVRNLMGGRQGNGQQMFSWIHAEDIARAILWVYMHDSISGSINVSAPNPIPNKTFMKVLRNAYGTPCGMPLSTWMLKLGTWMIGTETELLLKSRWVIPGQLVKSGFEFKYPTIEQAVEASV